MSMAARVSAAFRAGVRSQEQCSMEVECEVRSHEPADHMTRAFSLLRQHCRGEGVAPDGMGRWAGIPCETYTMQDGSVAYMPEAGWGADMMMYTAR